MTFVDQDELIEEEDDRRWRQSCREAMAELEAKWNDDGKTFAWFSKEPDYSVGALSWWWVDDPKAPCKRIYRFSLIGGGQVSTVENWRWFRWVGGRKKDESDGYPAFRWKNADAFLTYERPQHRLIATPHVAEGVERYRGFIGGFHADCSAEAAVFDKRVPQRIADRVAATFAAIGPCEDVFYALLDGSQGCAICGRPLRDEVSKLIGVGPDCARQNNVPHSLAAASRRLEIRRRILGEEA